MSDQQKIKTLLARLMSPASFDFTGMHPTQVGRARVHLSEEMPNKQTRQEYYETRVVDKAVDTFVNARGNRKDKYRFDLDDGSKVYVPKPVFEALQLKTVAHVATPAGMRRYHLPMHAPIIARPHTPPRMRVGRALEAVREPGGGYSVRLNGKVPKHGFMVSELKHGERIKAKDFLNEKIGKNALRSFVQRNAKAFDDPDVYIGLWHDPLTDEICLDISHNIQSREEALAMGKRENQQAIYDVEADNVIDTGGTGLKALREAREAMGRNEPGRAGPVHRPVVGSSERGIESLIHERKGTIYLSTKKVRHVASAAGVRRYHKPVGTPLVPGVTPTIGRNVVESPPTGDMLPFSVPMPEGFIEPTADDKRRIRNATLRPGMAEHVYAETERALDRALDSGEPPPGLDMGDFEYDDEPPPLELAVALGDWIYFGGARDIRAAAEEMLGFKIEEMTTDPGVRYRPNTGWGGADTPAKNPERDALILLHALRNSRAGSMPLYRGVDSPPQDMVDALKPGYKFDLPLASFTEGQAAAQRFGSDLIFRLDNPDHAFEGGEMSQWDHEYISGGRFEVTHIEEEKTWGGLTQEGLIEYIQDWEEQGDGPEISTEAIPELWDEDLLSEYGLDTWLAQHADRIPRWGKAKIVHIKQLGVFDPDTGLLRKDAQSAQGVPRWKWSYIFDTALAVPKDKKPTKPASKEGQ